MKATAALEKRKRREETLASLWGRVEGHVPAHFVGLVARIDAWLADRLANGPSKVTTRIVVDAPPGASKSTLATLLAARAVTRGIPTLYFSYSSSLSRAKSRKAQKIATGYLGAKLDPAQISPGHWATAEGTELHAAGLSGSATGHRGGVIVVDDFLLGRAHAESAAHRSATNDAVKAVARTRADPGALVIVISTRWHPDDPGAHAIAAGYERFHTPAITDAGESFWPERFDLEGLRAIEDEIGERDWQALYQGEPTQNASLLFHGATLLDPKDLPTGRLVITAGLDCAYSTRSASDFSVAVIEAQLGDGRTCVIDVLRAQDTIEDFAPKLLAFAGKHGNPTFKWRTGGQESIVAGLLRRYGLSIADQRTTMDKVSSAQRVASAWNRGRVLVLSRQPWTDAFVRVVTGFGPGSKRDDDVDALISSHDGVPHERGAHESLTHPRIEIVRGYDGPAPGTRKWGPDGFPLPPIPGGGDQRPDGWFPAPKRRFM